MAIPPGHGGNLLGKARSRDIADFTRVVNELSRADSGVVVFASASGSQLAQESPDWGNGAFTSALLEAFAGKAGPATRSCGSPPSRDIWAAGSRS